MAIDGSTNSFLERIQKLSPQRLALLAAELERRLAAHENLAPEPIAVTGIACRIPSGADTPDAFWQILSNAQDVIEVVPESRWDAEAFYDPNPDTPGKSSSKWGGFVRQVDQFDPAFFGIAPREAIGMDPQQRMLLEVAWEALEDAGERAESLDRSSTGVFVGMSTNDYASLITLRDDEEFDAYSGSGVARSTAAGRLSYFLGLKGPNLAVDTACSSSALAIHLACQSLRDQECRRALAGGVNAILVPQLTIMLSQAHMLAKDGRCKTFSRSADGFVRSEGCGVLVLKRLSDARADGDRIHGLIRGSATNHDGRSSGLTAPNGPSQEAVIRSALIRARLAPADVDYVEAHGTGTVLGDAIELGALANIFGRDRDAISPSGRVLQVGSVKTNVGHLEAAAGVTSVIKVLLGLQHEEIPAHLHVSQENQNEALLGQSFQVPMKAVPWPRTARPRVAGVSSFGFSGSNVHLILEEPPVAAVTGHQAPITVLLTASAMTISALIEICRRYAEFLHANPQISLVDFAFTTNACRTHFKHRVAFLATSPEDAARQFELLAASSQVGDSLQSASYHYVSGYEEPRIALLFTGQGSQYVGMGRGFYEQNSVFKSAIDACDRVLTGKLAHRLSSVIIGSPEVPRELIDETSWTQPVLFAFEYALFKMWESWGVHPAIVLGHSLGEYVAACVAGILSLEAAITLAYERGRLMGQLPRNGSMIAVHASEESILQAVGSLPATVSVAARNGPQSIVLSGRTEEINLLAKELRQKGIKSLALTVSHAFHSPMMNPMLDEFERTASKFRYERPGISFVSNVSGTLWNSGEEITPHYWRTHVRGTVNFAQGLSSLLAQEPSVLLELGPTPVLLGMAKAAYPDLSIPTVPAVRRGRDDWHSAFEAIQQLYLLGAAISWDDVYRDFVKRKLSIPTYPFQRQRYWITPGKSVAKNSATHNEQTSTKTESNSPVSERPTEPHLYEVQWFPQVIDRHTSLSPDESIAVAEQQIAGSAHDPELSNTLSAFSSFKSEMDRLCAGYILHAFRRMGVDLSAGSKVVGPDLAKAVGALNQHERLIQRLFAILEEDKVVQRLGESWEFQDVQIFDVVEEQQRTLERYPQFSAELNLLGQSIHLAEVLQGSMRPLEALFPNGSMALSEKVYQESPIASLFNRGVAAILRSIAEEHSISSQPRIRILEVGAGTGSTTSHLLPQLTTEKVDYIFTDVSAAFLTAAKRKFAAYPFVQYRILDAEKDSPSSGIAAHSIDIIVAANVVHATADLRKSLTHLTSLLRPGGTLILLEGTAPSRFGDLTVGMTDGWWRFTDSSFRNAYPLINRNQWLALLKELGLIAAALSEDGPASALKRNQTIVVARAPIGRPSTFSKSALLIGRQPHMLRETLTQSGISSNEEPYCLPKVQSSAGLQSLREQIRGMLQSSPNISSVILILADLSRLDDVPGATLEDASTVLGLIQEILYARSIQVIQRLPTIWLVTQGAFGMNNSYPLDTPSAAAAAIARVARLEHPDLNLRHVDLPHNTDSEDLKHFAELIQQGTSEHTVALRGESFFVPRLIQVESEEQIPALKIRDDGAYLITGAFAGLGLRIAEWLANQGAKELYLIGRREPSAAARQEILALQGSGLQIHTRVIDVSNRSQLEEFFGELQDASVDLHGIIHSAGTLDDGVLTHQTPERFAHVFGPKVKGGYYLHEFSLRFNLDFFVLFGSAASVLGSGGQANHAVANAFLDSLAIARQRQGLPATTIAWGPWSEIGAATRIKAPERGVSLGLGYISPKEGIALMQQAITSKIPALAALPIDWSTYLAPTNPHHGWPLFEKLWLGAQSIAVVESPTLSTLLDQVPAEQRLDVLQHYVKDLVLKVLMLDRDLPLPENQPFAELGLDSLMALELKNEIQKAVGADLPATFLFEYSTLRLASVYLDAILIGTRAGSYLESDSSNEEETVF